MTKHIKLTFFAAAAAGMMATAVPATAAPAFNGVSSSSDVTGVESSFQYRRDDRWRDRAGYRDEYGRRAYNSERAYNNRVWRGRDGRTYCRKKDGTTGLIIGGAAGALLGREIDGGHNRSLGTILGAAGGALLGREIARDGGRCR